MCAVPALVLAEKMVPALLSFRMVALPAVAVSVPPNCPKASVPPVRLVILALPALLASRKTVLPPFSVMSVALPAVLLFWNTVLPPSVVIEVKPEVLALLMKNRPSLVTSPMIEPTWVGSPSTSVAQLQMTVPPV